MGVDVEEQTVHAQGKVAVQQGLHHRRCLVPHATHLSKAFCLYDALAIDMGTTDGVQHVGRLVVGGRVKPVFAHRHVHIFIMLNAIRYHGGSHTLAAEADTIVACLLSDGGKEHLMDEFVDGQSDVAQHLVALGGRPDGDAYHDRQPGNEVVAPTGLELQGKLAAPVLRATLPRVYMQVLHHTGMGALLEQPKPRVYLLADSLARKLVALQSLGTTSRGIGIARRGMTDANNTVDVSGIILRLKLIACHAVTV